MAIKREVSASSRTGALAETAALCQTSQTSLRFTSIAVHTNGVDFAAAWSASDDLASNYINSAVDPEFRNFAWMIAKHESMTWAPGGQRVYNQFNPRQGLKEQPFKGNDLSADKKNYGWGMCQIDKGATGTVARVVYDWKQNVSEMNARLMTARRDYERYLSYFRELYEHNTGWCDPDVVTTNLANRIVTLRTWSILTLYNGTEGCPSVTLHGSARMVPFEFSPTQGRWYFHLNSKRYPVQVMEDGDLEECQ